MHYRRSIGTIALAAGLTVAAAAQAFDGSKYPDMSGLWFRSVPGNPRFDTSRPRGLPQQAPLKPEFQKLYEASLADQAAGGQGNHTVYRCLAWGMPAMMNGYGTGIEFVVLPETTYMLIDDGNDSVRRIFTDGRSYPTDFEPTFTGYSIGKWIDDGRRRKIRCAGSRDASASRGRASTTTPGSCCIPTTRASSTSGSI